MSPVATKYLDPAFGVLRPSKNAIAVAAWKQRNKQKKYAHKVVSRAIKSGTMVRQSCEKCGDSKTEAHHCDYSKPKEVMWLCKKHHEEWHSLYEAIYSTAA